ncbi:hypothetical protein [Enterococcus sp. AZ109]|uniref:hypothetical protein n=1 Tax=Enterococcus sp. AZ109 TaxID=2774634 RepID=UPI003F278F3C
MIGLKKGNSQNEFQKHAQLKRKYAKPVGPIVKWWMKLKGRRDTKKYMPVFIASSNVYTSPFLSLLIEEDKHVQNILWLSATSDMAPLKVRVNKNIDQYNYGQFCLKEMEQKLRAKAEERINLEQKLGEEKVDVSIVKNRREKDKRSSLSNLSNQKVQLTQEVNVAISELIQIREELEQLELITKEKVQIVHHHFMEKGYCYLQGVLSKTNEKEYPIEFMSTTNSFSSENEKNYLEQSDKLKRRLNLLLETIEVEGDGVNV